MDTEYSTPSTRVVEGTLPLRIRRFLRKYGDDVFLVTCVVLIALAAFGLGRYSVLRKEASEVQIVYPEGQEVMVHGVLSDTGEKNFVASVSGTKYHLPHCTGAARIKEENQVWFATAEEATIAGYEPAANCPGL